MRKALAVAQKEFRQIARDRRTLLVLLFVPLMFLLIYGYALNFDIRHVALALDDRDRSPASRDLVSAFTSSGYFDVVATIGDGETVEGLMDRGAIRAALIVPEDYGRRVATGRPAIVQLLVDGDNANTATIVIGYARGIARGLSADIQVRGGGPAVPLVTAEPRVWYNPELRSTLFLVPGLIAYIAMITAVVSTALSVVREKERGTMEQVRMAPIGAVPYVLGKTVPYFLISIVAELGIVLLAMALFDLPMRGSWFDLLLSLSVFLVGALGTGLLISTVADSQQVAFQMALLASFLPTLMLSDFIFPIASMPEPLQALTRLVPARYFLVTLRGIMLKGLSLFVFWSDLLALVVYAVAVIGLTSLRQARHWSHGA